MVPKSTTIIRGGSRLPPAYPCHPVGRQRTPPSADQVTHPSTTPTPPLQQQHLSPCSNSSLRISSPAVPADRFYSTGSAKRRQRSQSPMHISPSSSRPARIPHTLQKSPCKKSPLSASSSSTSEEGGAAVRKTRKRRIAPEVTPDGPEQQQASGTSQGQQSASTPT
uniref:Uncharacterized protein n=1 Tax=Chromera velia CCMP2878 TaxID=1169474 RepID=A0A0G4H1T6_9ALVE|eukprot:Cvel_24272.t1-p1 / transcript=Cvel_24272.t1 / gene=Cvel_24272 / organism=Chromera_velia_CCMP2878 / gene_product=hypothetical protein / transcript_product=hypothetical protein / location=Cvel_scaffold2603:489-983(+) / protein_length=165 / sequence_SO=supercontig / SO=protein_coding / is_pseudo=false